MVPAIKGVELASKAGGPGQLVPVAARPASREDLVGEAPLQALPVPPEMDVALDNASITHKSQQQYLKAGQLNFNVKLKGSTVLSS